MLKPSPFSPLTRTISSIWLDHIAAEFRGSRDRDLKQKEIYKIIFGLFIILIMMFNDDIIIHQILCAWYYYICSKCKFVLHLLSFSRCLLMQGIGITFLSLFFLFKLVPKSIRLKNKNFFEFFVFIGSSWEWFFSEFSKKIILPWTCCGWRSRECTICHPQGRLS